MTMLPLPENSPRTAELAIRNPRGNMSNHSHGPLPDATANPGMFSQPRTWQHDRPGLRHARRLPHQGTVDRP